MAGHLKAEQATTLDCIQVALSKAGQNEVYLYVSLMFGSLSKVLLLRPEPTAPVSEVWLIFCSNSNCGWSYYCRSCLTI